MDNHDDITRLAREHMNKCFAGKHGIGDKYKKQKEVTCNMCRRPMTVREHENPPYYCYRCCEELEVAQR
jgi:hypothetical protein